MPQDDPSDRGSMPPTEPSDPAADPGEGTEHPDPPERSEPAPADWRTSTYSSPGPPAGGHGPPERTPQASPPDVAERTPPEETPPARGRHLAWARLAAPPDDAVTTRLPTDHPEPTPPADTRPIGPPTPPETPPPTPPEPEKVEGPPPTGPPDARPSPPPETRPNRPPEGRPSPTTGTAPQARSGLADGPGVPSALGRLVAIVVTCGLAWALAVAVGVWLLVFLVSRSG